MGRREQEFRPGGLNGLSDGNRFVGGQVVDNDDIARGQRWNQSLLDIGQESRSIHGSVRNHRSGHTRQSESADECGGFPVTMRNRRSASFSSRRTSPHPCHFDRGPYLIDENQPLGRQIRPPIEPSLSTLRNVRALPFACVRCFFCKSCRGGPTNAGPRFEMSEGHEHLQDTRRSRPRLYPASHRPD